MRIGLFVFLFCLVAWDVRANVVGVSKSSTWLALVHYQPRVFGGYKSSIDTDNFFLSENGKTSPEDELNATIELFNGNDIEKQCLFPGRYLFLKKNSLVSKLFPKCEEFEKFKDDLKSSGVTLLFTDAYMNNPSSLFGHTLFRIDTSRKGTQLLAHGVNYGAFTGEQNGMLFAVKGLTGGYYGGFTVKPYYDVINMYNNIENRDIWELNLDLSREELDYFVAHLWEVGHAQTKYYFFTKNCSYLLMELLDAVRPGLHLAEQFEGQTIPLDTFKAVDSRAGMARGINYRPSRQAKIMHQYKQMNQKQRASYSKVIKKDEYDFEGLTDKEAAGVLDTAYQYTQYRHVEGEFDIEEYRKRSFKMLMERSRIKEKDNLEPLTEGKSPLDSHESMRAAMGAGFRNGEAFQEVSYRPAYHSLTDNNYGYLRGAEINFLEFTLRHYDDTDKYVLHNLDLVRIKSLTPVNEMFSPYSYSIRANVSREFNPRTEEEGYVFNLLFGGGGTAALTDNIWGYFMINNRGAYGGFLPNNQYLGIGPAVGVYADYGDVRFLGEVERIWATNKFGSRTRYNAEVTYSLGVNNTVGFRYSFEHNYGKNVSEPMVEYKRHF